MIDIDILFELFVELKARVSFEGFGDLEHEFAFIAFEVLLVETLGVHLNNAKIINITLRISCWIDFSGGCSDRSCPHCCLWKIPDPVRTAPHTCPSPDPSMLANDNPEALCVCPTSPNCPASPSLSRSLLAKKVHLAIAVRNQAVEGGQPVTFGVFDYVWAETSLDAKLILNSTKRYHVGFDGHLEEFLLLFDDLCCLQFFFLGSCFS